MEQSYEYLNNIALNDKSYFGGFYRFSMNVGRCFLRSGVSDNSDISIYTTSCIYSTSTIVVLLTYLIYGNHTFDDYIDDVEFLMFHIGMLLSNILVFIVKDNEKYSFIYLSIFKCLGYMSQYYYVYVVDLSVDLYESFFFDVLGKILDTINVVFDYVYKREDTTNEFWVYATLVCLVISFLIFIFTGSPLAYLFTFMGFLAIVLGTCIIGLVVLILPFAYIITFFLSMYVWGLVFLSDYVTFMRELNYKYGYYSYKKQLDQEMV